MSTIEFAGSTAEVHLEDEALVSAVGATATIDTATDTEPTHEHCSRRAETPQLWAQRNLPESVSTNYPTRLTITQHALENKDPEAADSPIGNEGVRAMLIAHQTLLQYNRDGRCDDETLAESTELVAELFHKRLRKIVDSVAHQYRLSDNSDFKAELMSKELDIYSSYLGLNGALLKNYAYKVFRRTADSYLRKQRRTAPDPLQNSGRGTSKEGGASQFFTQSEDRSAQQAFATVESRAELDMVIQTLTRAVESGQISQEKVDISLELAKIAAGLSRYESIEDYMTATKEAVGEEEVTKSKIFRARIATKGLLSGLREAPPVLPSPSNPETPDRSAHYDPVTILVDAALVSAENADIYRRFESAKETGHEVNFAAIDQEYGIDKRTARVRNMVVKKQLRKTAPNRTQIAAQATLNNRLKSDPEQFIVMLSNAAEKGVLAAEKIEPYLDAKRHQLGLGGVATSQELVAQKHGIHAATISNLRKKYDTLLIEELNLA